jgi:hypothetical protein
MNRFRLLALSLGLLALAGCDNPAPSRLKPESIPMAARPAPTPVVLPIAWDPSSQSFAKDGKSLRMVKLWSFDGSTDGFVLTGGDALPMAGPGLKLTNKVRDPALRSPKGLSLDGSIGNLVIVRLTRTRTGGAWDGTLFYSTANHPEAAGFRAVAMVGGNPPLNQVTILAYDMTALAEGGNDWTSSLIDQIRLDTDDDVGGTFIVHQIAVVQKP